ncbi:vitamin B12 transporter [Enhydrobacter aerosaccus]|uniref:Vitamin B12 transporter n=1 Tax=Enhydrobacter aerosaccus TaxID=225324 RepID=A0A1T4SR30_9HYPH|nr:TonB-dependent receptor [Enhydrobacter aerosaccus]SKA30358.1 vitamin B12 transporter [Enhydrobacter aerosaccus]
MTSIRSIPLVVLSSVLVASVLLALARMAAAQTETAPILPDTVVTADREETPRDKVTGTVTVVTGKEIEERQLRTVPDVLRYVPGVSVQQSGGPGSQTAVFVRGANASQTLTLIDGMNVMDPSTATGAIDFAHFMTENLDRIEVVRGPMSTLYGSAAMGGVINMVTKPGSGPMNGAAFTELGTRLQTTSGGFLRGSDGRFNYNISAVGLYAPGEPVVSPRFWPAQGGFIGNDPYRNITLASRLGVDLGDNAQLTLFNRYIDTQLKYDQITFYDPNANEWTQQLFNRLQFDGSFLDGRWKPTVGIGFNNIQRHDLDLPSVQNPFPLTQEAYYNGRRLQADVKNEFVISDNLNLLAGVDYDRSWLYSDADNSGSWGAATQTGFYGQGRATVFDTLTVSLGGRIDTHSQFGTVSTWRIGTTYLAEPTDTRFKASYGTAFKAPALFELYGSGFFCAGNPNLQPEYSRGYELGVEQGMFERKVKAGVTYFFNSFSNLIQCPPPYTGLQNIANAQSDGIETFLQLSPYRWVDVILNYTFTHAIDSGTGQPLVRRPTSVFGARADLRPLEGVRFGLELLQVSGRNDYDVVTGAIVQPSPYALLRATAGWTVRKGVELFARAENLLDQQYEEPEGFKAPNFQAFFGVKATF